MGAELSWSKVVALATITLALVLLAFLGTIDPYAVFTILTMLTGFVIGNGNSLRKGETPEPIIGPPKPPKGVPLDDDDVVVQAAARFLPDEVIIAELERREREGEDDPASRDQGDGSEGGSDAGEG